MKPEELRTVLAAHRKWLVAAETGKHADLQDAKLQGANLYGARLQGAHLRGANLQGANLRGADLQDANLQDADLQGANLYGARLRDAFLRGADLQGVIMPDGRTWEKYRADHLAGLCQTAKTRANAIAAWGKHAWQDCPMAAAHGWQSSDDAGEQRLVVDAWVALYDSSLLEKPANGVTG